MRKKAIYDYRKLRGKIREMELTIKSFGSKIGLSEVSITFRLENKLQFKQNEIMLACDALHIAYGDIPIYFFTKVLKKS